MSGKADIHTDERYYTVAASFLVKAPGHWEAMQKVNRLKDKKLPKGVSFDWVIQATYTDAHNEKEFEQNESWTNYVPKERAYSDDYSDYSDD